MVSKVISTRTEKLLVLWMWLAVSSSMVFGDNIICGTGNSSHTISNTGNGTILSQEDKNGTKYTNNVDCTVKVNNTEVKSIRLKKIGNFTRERFWDIIFFGDSDQPFEPNRDSNFGEDVEGCLEVPSTPENVLRFTSDGSRRRIGFEFQYTTSNEPCITSAPATAPEDWTCDTKLYSDGVCDCGCGANDADCDIDYSDNYGFLSYLYDRIRCQSPGAVGFVSSCSPSTFECIDEPDNAAILNQPLYNNLGGTRTGPKKLEFTDIFHNANKSGINVTITSDNYAPRMGFKNGLRKDSDRLVQIQHRVGGSENIQITFSEIGDYEVTVSDLDTGVVQALAETFVICSQNDHFVVDYSNNVEKSIDNAGCFMYRAKEYGLPNYKTGVENNRHRREDSSFLKIKIINGTSLVFTLKDVDVNTGQHRLPSFKYDRSYFLAFRLVEKLELNYRYMESVMDNPNLVNLYNYVAANNNVTYSDSGANCPTDITTSSHSSCRIVDHEFRAVNSKYSGFTRYSAWTVDISSPTNGSCSTGANSCFEYYMETDSFDIHSGATVQGSFRALDWGGVIKDQGDDMYEIALVLYEKNKEEMFAKESAGEGEIVDAYIIRGGGGADHTFDFTIQKNGTYYAAYMLAGYDRTGLGSIKTELTVKPFTCYIS